MGHADDILTTESGGPVADPSVDAFDHVGKALAVGGAIFGGGVPEGVLLAPGQGFFPRQALPVAQPLLGEAGILGAGDGGVTLADDGVAGAVGAPGGAGQPVHAFAARQGAGSGGEHMGFRDIHGHVRGAVDDMIRVDDRRVPDPEPAGHYCHCDVFRVEAVEESARS